MHLSLLHGVAIHHGRLSRPHFAPILHACPVAWATSPRKKVQPAPMTWWLPGAISRSLRSWWRAGTLLRGGLAQRPALETSRRASARRASCCRSTCQTTRRPLMTRACGPAWRIFSRRCEASGCRTHCWRGVLLCWQHVCGLAGKMQCDPCCRPAGVPRETPPHCPWLMNAACSPVMPCRRGAPAPAGAASPAARQTPAHRSLDRLGCRCSRCQRCCRQLCIRQPRPAAVARGRHGGTGRPVPRGCSASSCPAGCARLQQRSSRSRSSCGTATGAGAQIVQVRSREGATG